MTTPYRLRWIRPSCAVLLGVLLASVALLPEPAQIQAQTTTPLFGAPQILSENGTRKLVAVGDLDGDGALDIVLGGQYYNYYKPFETRTLIFFNNGEGQFSTSVELAADSAGASDIALADLDGNGALDVVIAGTKSNLADKKYPARIYFNNGHGHFAPVYELPDSIYDASIAIGDLDGDGDFDLVLNNSIYFNDGKHSFSRVTVVSSAFSYYKNALADLNKDGALDLILVRSSNYLAEVYLNDHSGHFASPLPLPYSGSRYTESISVGDLDNNGTFDVVLGNYFNYGETSASLVYLNNGQGPFAPPHELGFEAPYSELGDINSDGALDIVFENTQFEGAGVKRPTAAVALNDGKSGFSERFMLQDPGDAEIQLGDLNGDGALDIVNGNRIYLHTRASSLGQETRLLDPDKNFWLYGRVALADMNNDGSQDLIVIDGYNDNSQVFFNDGQGHFPSSTALADDARTVVDAAVGDLNNDGALDLVLANAGGINYNFNPPPEADRVYLNEGSGHFSKPQELDGSKRPSSAVALGDLNGDGSLDLVFANARFGDSGKNQPMPAEIYLNDGLAHFSQPVDLAGSEAGAQAVAVADLNGDDAPDLVLGGAYTGEVALPAQSYINDGSGRFGPPIALPDSSKGASTLALGDLNGDGALDLVLNRAGDASLIYFNDGTGRFVSTSSLLLRDISGARDIALGDLNNDGTIDIVLDGYSEVRTYLNDGGGRFASSKQLLSSEGYPDSDSIALGDLNGDGGVDLVRATYENGIGAAGPLTAYLNQGARSTHLINNPASVVVGRIGHTGSTQGFASSEILDSPVIAVPYSIVDPEGDATGAISVTYSLDGGGSWLPAAEAAAPAFTVSSAFSHHFQLPFTPVDWRLKRSEGVFYWDVRKSGIFGQSDNVVVRVEVLSGVRPTPNGLAGPYLHPYAAATSYPFRLRGTQVQVLRTDSGGTKSAVGALVYRLPAGQTRGAQSLSDRAGQPSRTNGQGYLGGRGQLIPGDQLVALLPVTSTDTYTLYQTSAAPTLTGLETYTVTATGVQTLTVSPQHPLVTLNLSVSLEWDASSDAPFLAQLASDLTRTGELLFDWSDGQMTLGDITVYQDKQHWDDAPIRVYATNRLRPNANQGGIVTEPVSETVTVGGASHVLTYDPGQVRMGAVWNRYGESAGTLGEDWPRTLAHELSHFALFLDDDYLGLDAAGRLISVTGCPSAMSDPYRDDWGEYHPDAGWQEQCGQTLAANESGRSDWATISRFYAWPALGMALRPPTQFNANPGPNALPLALTRVRIVPPSDAARPLDDPTVALTRDGARVLPSASARGFLFPQSNDRIVDLGQPLIDQMRARGARAGDRLCVYDLAAATPQLGCAALAADSAELALVAQPGWRPDIAITPADGHTLTITVDNLAPGLSLRARLFPSYVEPGTPPTYDIALSPDATGYQCSITSAADAIGFEGYVQVWVDEPAPRREVVVNYSLGGNPGLQRKRGAPRGNPGLQRKRGVPVLSADGQALLFSQAALPEGAFYALQTSSVLPSRPLGRSQVGQAYRLTASVGAPLAGASLNISYLERELLGNEANLQLYYWDGTTWTPLQTAVDSSRNEATATVRGPGVYVLMASAALPLQQGWNNIAYPIVGSRPVGEALQSITGAYRVVDSYEYGDWKVYSPDAPPWASDLAEMRYGQGYWLYATQAVTAYLDVTPPQLAAANLTPPALLYGLLPSGVAAGATVEARVGGVLCGQAQARVVDGTQVAFVVKVAAEGEGSAGCGVSGREVRLVVGSYRASATWDNTRAQQVTPS